MKKHPLLFLAAQFKFFYQLEIRNHSYVMVLYDENTVETDAEYFDEGSLRLIWNDSEKPGVTYPFNTLLEYLRKTDCAWMKYLRKTHISGKSEMYYIELFRKIWTRQIDELLDEARNRLDSKMEESAANEEERRQLSNFFEADLIHFTDLNSQK